MEIREIMIGNERMIMVTLRPDAARRAGFAFEIAADVVDRSGSDKDANDQMAKQ